ncbi:radical SAM protein [Geotalea sp. SG265]|uniref:B12-binding domain-containing radical SAM protein n=1 Tax=Geotalea sp. SG265 TaxID=2922867 RepID=UPI001FAF2CB9|nr:radical SAM protein [Geotalea sp. SG265]
MKVLLVNPPLRRMVSANVPAFVEKERGTYPPLGLLYIAAYLRERGPVGIEVQVLDTVLMNLTDQQIEEHVREANPDVIGVQTLTFTLLDSLSLVQIAKKVNPHITTVLGGRHCDHYPVETLCHPGVDFVVTGEGEVTMTCLVEHLNDLDILKDMPGLTFRYGDRIVNNPGIPIEKLDELPFPARDMTPYGEYRFLLAKDAVFTTLVTSRGCPYRCSFCDEGHHKFRAFSAQRVVEEILDCRRRLGIRQFFIFDSTFTVDRQRVLDICALLLEHKVDVSFDIRSRIDLMDDEMLHALKQAGCSRIQYGVESGNNGILAAIGKNITVEQVRQVVHKTRTYGFEILCDFMIGLPGETAREVEDTIRLALELPINYAQFAITTPYPGTALYRYGMEKGLFGDYWGVFSRDPSEEFRAHLWEESLDRKQLTDLMMQAYERFYFRPAYIVQELRNMNSLSEIYHKIKAGLRLAFCSVKERM